MQPCHTVASPAAAATHPISTNRGFWFVTDPSLFSLSHDIGGLRWLQHNTLCCCVYQTHRCSVHGDELLPDYTITPR
ncbi:hypothetical protein BHE74_00031829 [Ensete ventricosum]|nr:hypothetical protein BHE74_00031829 [Ensete ventricosum]